MARLWVLKSRTGQQKIMRKDDEWKNYLYDKSRYADVINGMAFGGRQVVSAEDMGDLDSQTGFVKEPVAGRSVSRKKKKEKGRTKYRDALKRTAFGVNYAVVGIEPEEYQDYSMPLRDMYYSVGEYEKQAAEVRSRARAEKRKLKNGEYLYRFPKGSLLHPVVTIILYMGRERWDGPRTLHEMLDFTGMPEEIRKMAPDYKMNIIDVRRMEDTGMFRTDVQHVLDFIRLSEDREALKRLVESEPYYKEMEEDAFDVAVCYANAGDLIRAKEYNRKDGGIDVCTAIKEMIEEGRKEGKEEGRKQGRKEGIRRGRKDGRRTEKTRIVRSMIQSGMPEEKICGIVGCSTEFVWRAGHTLD